MDPSVCWDRSHLCNFPARRTPHSGLQGVLPSTERTWMKSGLLCPAPHNCSPNTVCTRLCTLHSWWHWHERVYMLGTPEPDTSLTQGHTGARTWSANKYIFANQIRTAAEMAFGSLLRQPAAKVPAPLLGLAGSAFNSREGELNAKQIRPFNGIS